MLRGRGRRAADGEVGRHCCRKISIESRVKRKEGETGRAKKRVEGEDAGRPDTRGRTRGGRRLL